MGDGPITSVPFLFFGGSLNFPTRWDATDSDVSSNISQLLSPALQQSSHSKLWSRVESCWWVGRNSVTGHGADHDDLTISHIVLAHQVHWDLGAETQSKNIHIQHLPPRLHGSFTEVLCRWESSIVDADVHLAQLRVRWDPVEHGPDVFLRTQITSSREKLATTQVMIFKYQRWSSSRTFPFSPARAWLKLCSFSSLRAHPTTFIPHFTRS